MLLRDTCGMCLKKLILGLVNHLQINQIDWFSKFLAGWQTNQLQNRHKVTWPIKKPDVADWHSLAKRRLGLRPRARPLQAPPSGAAVSRKPCCSALRCCHSRSAMLLYKRWPQHETHPAPLPQFLLVSSARSLTCRAGRSAQAHAGLAEATVAAGRKTGEARALEPILPALLVIHRRLWSRAHSIGGDILHRQAACHRCELPSALGLRRARCWAARLLRTTRPPWPFALARVYGQANLYENPKICI